MMLGDLFKIFLKSELGQNMLKGPILVCEDSLHSYKREVSNVTLSQGNIRAIKYQI